MWTFFFHSINEVSKMNERKRVNRMDLQLYRCKQSFERRVLWKKNALWNLTNLQKRNILKRLGKYNVLCQAYKDTILSDLEDDRQILIHIAWFRIKVNHAATRKVRHIDVDRSFRPVSAKYTHPIKKYWSIWFVRIIRQLSTQIAWKPRNRF